MIRSIIVDDEHFGRQALKVALETYCPEVKIEVICEGPEQAIEVIPRINPDLVFLDVQMPVMSGFDLLQKVSPVDFEVIFVTAFDQYAIKAIRFSALDYLMKPVDIDDLKSAIERVKERLTQKNSSYQYQSVLNNIQRKGGRIERLAVPTYEGIDFFNTDDIIFCKADGSYTQVVQKNKISIIISRNLKDFESLLSDSGFCRVHHSYLINMRHVLKYIKGEGGYVLMTENHHVDISRRKKEEFLKLLDKI